MRDAVGTRVLACAVLGASISFACGVDRQAPHGDDDDVSLAQAALSETTKTPHPNNFLAHHGGGLEGMAGIAPGGIVANPNDTGYANEVSQYYATIGATPLFSLEMWKINFNFPQRQNGETLQEFRNRAGVAVYYNENELGLGREMGCSTFVDGYDSHNIAIMGQACYVTNYGTLFNDKTNALTDAVKGLNVKNTVCISYLPHLPQGKRVQFYVYGETSLLQNWAQLDLMGKRAVPQVCTTCHGGTYDAANDLVVDGRFLPTNVNHIGYAEDVIPGVDPGLTKAGQVERFRRINNLAYQTPLQDTQMQFVTALYNQKPGTMNQPAASSAVPPGWAPQATLWDRVVNPYCGTCHMAAAGGSATPAYKLINSWSGFNSSALNGATAFTSNRDYVRAQVCMSTLTPSNATWSSISSTFQSLCGSCHKSGAPGLLGTEYNWSDEKKVLKHAGKIYNSITDIHPTMPPGVTLTVGQKTALRGYLATIAGMPHAQPTMKKFWDFVDPVLGKTPKKALFDEMGVPDCDQPAPQGCNTNAQCGALSSGKVCSNGLCVDNCQVAGCPPHSQCSGGTLCEACGRHGQWGCGGSHTCEAPAVNNTNNVPGWDCVECATDAQCPLIFNTRCAAPAQAGPGNARRCVQCTDPTAPLGGGQCGAGKRCDSVSNTCVRDAACGTSNSCTNHGWCNARGVCITPPSIGLGQDIEDKFDFNGQVKWYSLAFYNHNNAVGDRSAQASIDVAAAVPAVPAVGLAALSTSDAMITNSADFRALAQNGAFGIDPQSTSGNFNIQSIAFNGTNFGGSVFLRATNVSGAQVQGGRFTLTTTPKTYGLQRMRYQQRLIHKGEEHWWYVKADGMGRVSIELEHDQSQGQIQFEVLDEGPWSAVATSVGGSNHVATVFIPSLNATRNIFYGPTDGRNYVVHVTANWPGAQTMNTYILTAGNPHVCDDQFGSCQNNFIDVSNVYNPSDQP